MLALGLSRILSLTAGVASVPSSGGIELFSASIAGPEGRAAAGARVAVYAYPARLPRGTITTTLLAETHADARGNVSVRTRDKAAVRRAAAPDGTVHLLIEADGPQGAVTLDHQIALKTDLTARGSTPAKLRLSAAGIDTAALAAPRTSASSSGYVSKNHNCINGADVQWIPQNSIKRVDVKLQQLMTGKKSTVRYDWSNSSKTRMGVTYEYPHAKNGTIVKVKAGMSHSVTEASGVNFARGTNRNEWAAVDWEYRKYKKYCHVDTGGYHHRFYDAGSWQWRPRQWTGGNSYIPTKSIFRCSKKYDSTISARTWVARSSSRVISGGVVINGLSADVQQTNDTSHRLTFVPTGRSARICGKNNYPINASTVKEVP
jgi:hypothetical protein